jgi:hypothetical protein
VGWKDDIHNPRLSKDTTPLLSKTSSPIWRRKSANMERTESDTHDRNSTEKFDPEKQRIADVRSSPSLELLLDIPKGDRRR